MHDQILQPASDVWRHHCAALVDALTQAIRELDRLVRLDEYHRHGHDPQDLEKAIGPLGSSALDLNALSRILGESTRTRAMAPDRLERVQRLLKELGEMKARCVTDPHTCASIEIDEDENTIHEAAENHLNRMATVFRALRIAQLETRSKYDPGTHDAVFSSFDWRQLSPAELRLCPPFLVIARLNRETGPQLRKMMSLLESRKPVKIAALRSSFSKSYSSTSDTSVPASMALETLPLAMRGVSFVQTCIAAPDFQKRIFDGLTSPRPGVISLLCRRDDEAHEAFVLRAERAIHSRAFPICVYDPDRAHGFVTCFDLSANPSPETLWISETFSAPDENGEIRKHTEPYTFAHFAAGEEEFASEFTAIDPAVPADHLIPIADYLDLTRRQRVGVQPVLTRHHAGQAIDRRVVSQVMVTQTGDRLHLWRTLQEISGINNPYVNTTRSALSKEFGVQQKALLESLQRDMEKAASHREQVAVAAAVRKLVAHLTGVDASEIDLRGILPPPSEAVTSPP
ncbi:MAG: hypothetical protein R3F07_13340 [Opitutaceae bacterium]